MITRSLSVNVSISDILDTRTILDIRMPDCSPGRHNIPPSWSYKSLFKIFYKLLFEFFELADSPHLVLHMQAG